MKLLITKKSRKPFPPPFDGNGLTAIVVVIITNQYDPKHRQAYVLKNGAIVNCDKCKVLENLEIL